LTAARRDADFFWVARGVLLDGVRDFGGFFDKCLLEK